MLPGTTPPPDLSAFEHLVRTAYAHLPEYVRQHSDSVVIAVAEAADPGILAELGLDDPLELTGLYDGVPMSEQSQHDFPRVPDTVWLYREAILAEWEERRTVPLPDLISHVLVHEIAHHFGMSDEDIARIDPWWL